MIRPDSPAQHELRRRVEISVSSKYLRGSFVVDFIRPKSDAEYERAIRKEKTCQEQEVTLKKEVGNTSCGMQAERDGSSWRIKVFTTSSVQR